MPDNLDMKAQVDYCAGDYHRNHYEVWGNDKERSFEVFSKTDNDTFKSLGTYRVWIDGEPVYLITED